MSIRIYKQFRRNNIMLDGIPKKDYPKVFYNYFRELLDVLLGKTSLKLYLLKNYPSIFKNRIRFNDNEEIYCNGIKIIYNKRYEFISNPFDIIVGILLPLSGQYFIPECHVQRGDVVLDCGAYLGGFSIHAVMMGASKVYAFEPTPKTFEKLIELTQKFEKIIPVKKAIYSKNCIKEFQVFGDFEISEGNKIITNDLNNVDGKKITVECVSIDNFIKENNISKVNFIKMDIEGAEREAIKGAKKTIKTFKPRMAISAYHLPNDKEIIPELVLSIRDDYRYKLVKRGYDLIAFFY